MIIFILFFHLQFSHGIAFPAVKIFLYMKQFKFSSCLVMWLIKTFFLFLYILISKKKKFLSFPLFIFFARSRTCEQKKNSPVCVLFTSWTLNSQNINKNRTNLLRVQKNANLLNTNEQRMIGCEEAIKIRKFPIVAH